MVRKILRKIFGKKQSQEVAQHATLQDLHHLQQHLYQLHSGLMHQQNHMQQWHSHVQSSLWSMHRMHKTLENNHNEHSQGLQSHKQEISSEMKQLQRIANQLGTEYKQQQQATSVLQNDVSKLKNALGQTFSAYNDQILQLHKEILAIKQQQKEQEKQAHLPAPEPEKAPEPAPEPIPEPKQPAEMPEKRSSEHFRQNLTPSEKKILALLVATDKKYSYRDIAAAINKSPSTVKTQVCSLKNKGVPISEITDADGSKRYFIPAALKPAV